ncbi:hypothetical protein GOODEAATRI_004114 [Goodea atripinnis]|uniref:Uncharacterized protein n=1 Tax=Goodea atripinnis TaxID=208336 RepID=A0ABV0MYI4_9TELE
MGGICYCVYLFQHQPDSSSSPVSSQLTSRKEATKETFTASHEKPAVGLSHSSNLRRTNSIKDLISRFSGPTPYSFSSSSLSPFSGSRRVIKSVSMEALYSPNSKLSPFTPSTAGQVKSPLPSVTVTPSRDSKQNEARSVQKGTKSKITARIDCPVGGSTRKTDPEKTSKPKTPESGRDSLADSGMGSESEFDSNKQSDSPSEEELSTPRATTVTQNPKYQLLMNHDLKTNGLGSREAKSPGGGGSVGDKSPRLSRWETTRLGTNNFRGSLESLASRDWDTGSDRGGLSPATSEMNLYSFNNRSTSPIGVPTPTLTPTRTRFSTYDTLRRRTDMNNTVLTHIKHTHVSLRGPMQNHCLQFVLRVAPIHYSMRSATLGAPNKRDFIEELTKQLDACQKIEVTEAREMMVEANTQEYAFNFLQQSLKNKIQDAEGNLEKQTQHAQTLAEKLWLKERKLEEMEVDGETREKKMSDLNSTILRLEDEVQKYFSSGGFWVRVLNNS